MGGKRGTPKWIEGLINMYKDGRIELLDGELRAFMGRRETYYEAKKILVETGMAEARTVKGGMIIWRINWDVVKKHPVTRPYFEALESEPSNQSEKSEVEVVE